MILKNIKYISKVIKYYVSHNNPLIWYRISMEGVNIRLMYQIIISHLTFTMRDYDVVH